MAILAHAHPLSVSHHTPGLKALVIERGQVRDTGRQVGDAGHRVDTAEPSILALLKVDAAWGEDGGVLIKEVIGSEQEANSVPQSHCVGDILSMGNVQEAGCNPSHQVLQEKGGARGLWRQDSKNHPSATIPSLQP